MAPFEVNSLSSYLNVIEALHVSNFPVVVTKSNTGPLVITLPEFLSLVYH